VGFVRVENTWGVEYAEATWGVGPVEKTCGVVVIREVWAPDGAESVLMALTPFVEGFLELSRTRVVDRAGREGGGRWPLHIAALLFSEAFRLAASARISLTMASPSESESSIVAAVVDEVVV
jgi:hypothetical protein